MKVVEGTLTPLREVGTRVPNYLDDWPLLAQSREQLCDHRDLVLRHLSQWGLRVNWEKSKLSHVQRISFLSVLVRRRLGRLMEERAQAVLNCLSSFRGRNVVPLKRIASCETTSALATLPGPEVRYTVSGYHPAVSPPPQPWTDKAFLRAGVPLEQVSRHTVVTTDVNGLGR